MQLAHGDAGQARVEAVKFKRGWQIEARDLPTLEGANLASAVAGQIGHHELVGCRRIDRGTRLKRGRDAAGEEVDLSAACGQHIGLAVAVEVGRGDTPHLCAFRTCNRKCGQGVCLGNRKGSQVALVVP